MQNLKNNKTNLFLLFLLSFIIVSCDNIQIKLYNYAVEENQKTNNDTIKVNMEVLLGVKYDTMFVFEMDSRLPEIRDLIKISDYKKSIWEKYVSDILVKEYETKIICVKNNRVVYEDYFYNHDEKYEILSYMFLSDYPANAPSSDYFTRYASSTNKEFYLIRNYYENNVYYRFFSERFC